MVYFTFSIFVVNCLALKLGTHFPCMCHLIDFQCMHLPSISLLCVEFVILSCDYIWIVVVIYGMSIIIATLTNIMAYPYVDILFHNNTPLHLQLLANFPTQGSHHFMASFECSFIHLGTMWKSSLSFGIFQNPFSSLQGKETYEKGIPLSSFLWQASPTLVTCHMFGTLTCTIYYIILHWYAS